MGFCIASGVTDANTGADMSGWYVRASRRVVVSVSGVVQATLEFFKDKASATAGKEPIRSEVIVSFSDDYTDDSMRFTPNFAGALPSPTPATGLDILVTQVYKALPGRADLPYLANAASD
jgi:hypothetical protein